MRPSNLYYCLHNGILFEEDASLTIITLAPINYWNENKALPDYIFLKHTKCFLPKEYSFYVPVAETQWCVSNKSTEDIRNELDKLGLTYNKDMETFLSGLWETNLELDSGNSETYDRGGECQP
jgi:hypothetical protein